MTHHDAVHGTVHSPAQRATGCLLAVVGILLATSACGTRSAVPGNGSAEVAEGAAALSLTAADEISVDRGACYGQCPVYRVTVRGDGAVTFDGQAFVADSGVHSAQLEPAQIRTLFARFDASPFASADSAYVEGAPNCGDWVADAPQLTMRRARSAGVHTVRFDPGCTAAPRWISMLAAAVDSAVDTDRWITANPSRQ